MQLQIINDGKLFKISSVYSMKTIFSYLDHNYLLKLVRYNKELQNQLEISLENYKIQTNYCILKRKVKKLERKYHEFSPSYILFTFHPYIAGTFLLLFLVYTILLFVVINLYGEFETKANYDNNLFNIIKNINFSLFIFIIFFICSNLSLHYYIFENYDIVTKEKKKIKIGILIAIDLVHIIYEGLVIWKLALSYEIKKNKITWFMVLDYLFIILNFIYMIYIILSIIFYYFDAGKSLTTFIEYFLTKFKGIDIQNYELPNNFDIMERKEKINLILEKAQYFKLFISQKELDLILLINQFREKNNIPKLKLPLSENIPSFIINPSSEIFLSFKNIFKLKSNEYLFRYNIGEFENKLNNNDNDIINILLKENLNSILVIRQDNIQYIYIFETSERLNDDFKVFEREIKKHKSEQDLFLHSVSYSNEDKFYNINDS